MTPDPSDRPLTVVVAVTEASLVPARATVRSAAALGLPCLVVDVDHAWRVLGAEDVASLDVVAREAAVAEQVLVAAATLDDAGLRHFAGAAGAELAHRRRAGWLLVVGAGVVLLADPTPLVLDPDGAAGTTTELVVVPAVDTRGVLRLASGPLLELVDRRSGRAEPARPPGPPVLSRGWYAARADALAGLRDAFSDWRTSPAALEIVTGTAPTRILPDPSVLLTAWRGVGSTDLDDQGRMTVGGEPVAAVDLADLDAAHPWTMVAEPPAEPRVLLSAHPALAAFVRAEADRRRADREGLGPPGGGPGAAFRSDPVLRGEARRVHQGGGQLPDVLGALGGPTPTAWALDPVPAAASGSVARYLAAVRQARPDLQAAFRRVPGADARALAGWALRSGLREPGYDRALLKRAAQVTRGLQSGTAATGAAPGAGGSTTAPGVNVVGYLSGELGLGVSARLMVDAMRAARISLSLFDVGGGLTSRRRAAFEPGEAELFDTTLLCINGADLPARAAELSRFRDARRVIGMWYWELEDVPADQRAGFGLVDEVWVATDFMREAFAAHAPDGVAVRTVMPPLPQARADIGEVPSGLGIPEDRPWFLFTFDFLSLAERKNPWGTVDAFTRAFSDLAEVDRPVLVIKTINAQARPADAERLRIMVAGRRDVVFVDAYLDDDQRHVLVARCAAYVSLHHAEGLGLTVAEAMAYGRPVVATGYGGVTQFCTDENAFLVRWRPGVVEETAGPYEAGMTWADPDLDHAAQLLRGVVDDPATAERIGRRAAQDLRKLHSPEVAGAKIREALAAGARTAQPRDEPATTRRPWTRLRLPGSRGPGPGRSAGRREPGSGGW